MDLAYRMGYPTPDIFLRSISLAEWTEWKAWRKIRGPIGPERLDTLAAFVAMHIRGTVKSDVEFKGLLDDVRWFVEAVDNEVGESEEE